MPPRRVSVNPFYVVLVGAGIAFCVTACAYGMMAVRSLRAAPSPSGESAATGLVPFMDRHGVLLMAIEIGVLAVATVAAITTDGYWSKQENTIAKPTGDEVDAPPSTD